MMSDLEKSDLHELLLQSASKEKFYFESKDGLTTVLALGPTETVPFSKAPQFLQNNPELLLWSAMSFENVSASSFYASYLTLFKKNGKVKLIINPHLIGDQESCFNFQKDEPLNPIKSIEHTPDYANWALMLNEALELLNQDTLTKIVLKRKKIIEFQNTIHPLHVFEKVYSPNSECYKIFVQDNPSQGFISLTPETLFSLTNNRTINTMSVAGSVPRGTSKAEETQFEEELKHSTKLIHEQNVVTDEINKRLQSIAEDVQTSELDIMKLQYIQHRANYIKAELNNDKSFLDIITTLHPTPAVGGSPNNLALNAIASLEKDTRNNYAAPIGFATLEYSEWAVGLRSAIINNKTVTVFAGCGVVTGSIPEAEWLETENKMRPFADLYTEVPGHV